MTDREHLLKWLHRDTCSGNEKLYRKIEKALGFKLFVWQKTYIEHGVFRCYGKTTAQILRELLNTKAEPIDFRQPARSHKEQFYRQELMTIKHRLEAEGVKTRAVITRRNSRYADRDTAKGGLKSAT